MRISVGLHGALIMHLPYADIHSMVTLNRRICINQCPRKMHQKVVARDTGRSGEHLKDDASLARDSVDLIVQRSCDKGVC